jgi:hypothetical protein
MSGEFTPGPWRVVSGDQIRSDIHQIARAWMMRNGEGKANAHLIAAAPRMHAALLNAKAILQLYQRDSDDMVREAINEIKDVLADAEGQS